MVDKYRMINLVDRQLKNDRYVFRQTLTDPPPSLILKLPYIVNYITVKCVEQIIT